MPTLSSLIPSQFAKECAVEGFVGACRGAVEQIVNAPTGTAAASVLAGATTGPATFLAIYCGGAILQWKHSKRKEQEAEARFRQVLGALHRIEAGVNDRNELVGLLDELLRQNQEMHKRLEAVQADDDGRADNAIVEIVQSVFAELEIEESFNGVRIYLSNISDWLIEVRDTTREIDRKQDVQLENQSEMLRLLNKIDQRQKSAGDQPPALSEEDRRILAEARAHGNAKEQARAAIMQRDFAAADPLIEEVTHRAASELFDALTLKGDRHYYAGEYDAAIGPYEKAFELRSHDLNAGNNAAIAHNKARLGSIEKHQCRAIEIYTRSLKLIGEGSLNWAMTQHNLGNAYANLPSGDRAANLSIAIGAYESALEVYTREAHPVDWATTQNNLGNAYASLPSGDRAANLSKAIGAYKSALEVRTREAHPVDWAMTQNNLGVAYASLPSGDRAANLSIAIGAYKSALEVRTREAHPVDWAMTQNNLGVAYANLPSGDRAANLSIAIGAFKSAMEVYTREAHPVDWAMTQNNLGNAYANLPSGDRAANLSKAIGAHESALEVCTREAHPVDWATTQNNLGNAYANLPSGDRAANLSIAIGAYKSALEIRTREAHPVDWAMTQNNLGTAYASLPSGDRAANLSIAIGAYKSALEVRTREAHPVDWAGTQNNLGTAYASLARLQEQDRCQLLRRAIASAEASLTVLTADAFPHYHAGARQALEAHRLAYEESGCA
jgi:predicted LPLAT superfamily acyltransferase